MNAFRLSLLVMLLPCLAAQLKPAMAQDVTVEASEDGATIKADGELFAEYLTDAKHQPAVWPIFGPTGKPITRSYPIGPLLDTENDDHPHHHSLWFAMKM